MRSPPKLSSVLFRIENDTIFLLAVVGISVFIQGRLLDGPTRFIGYYCLSQYKVPMKLRHIHKCNCIGH